MGQRGKEALKEMDDEGKKFAKTAKDLAKSGDLSGLIQGYEMFGDRIKDLGDKAEASEKIFGRLQAQMISVMGGPSVDEQRQKLLDARIESMKLSYETQKEIVNLSSQDVEIARMRAEGEDDAADAIERQRDLAKEIAKINATNLGLKAKEKLIADATEKSRLDAQKEPNKKARDDRQEEADTLKELRFRRAVIREKEQREKEQGQGAQSAFDGKRRKIMGYQGGSSGRTGPSFNEFFHPEETQFGQKSPKHSGDQTFDEFFHPRGRQSAMKNASTTNTRMHQASAAKPEEKLLADIRDGINQLVAI
jgi:hypothetical protein